MGYMSIPLTIIDEKKHVLGLDISRMTQLFRERNSIY